MARSDSGDEVPQVEHVTPISDAIRRHMRTRNYIRSELIGGPRGQALGCFDPKPTDLVVRFL